MTDFPNLEFVDLYVDYLLNISIERAFSAFSAGFHLVCGSDVLKVLPNIVITNTPIALLTVHFPNIVMSSLRTRTAHLWLTSARLRRTRVTCALCGLRAAQSRDSPFMASGAWTERGKQEEISRLRDWH